MNDMPRAPIGTTVLPPPRFMAPQAAAELIYMLISAASPDTATIGTAETSAKNGAVVQLIAAQSGDGTSSIAWDLALVGAGQAGLKLLLVAVEPDHAWADHLTGALSGGKPDAAPRRVGDTRLSLAQLAGQDQPNLWFGQIQTWRASFDLVLLDTQSMTRSSAGMLLASHVDTTLIVVAAERTDMEAAQSLRDRLWDAGGHTRGCILNRRLNRTPGFIARRL